MVGFSRRFEAFRRAGARGFALASELLITFGFFCFLHLATQQFHSFFGGVVFGFELGRADTMDNCRRIGLLQNTR